VKGNNTLVDAAMQVTDQPALDSCELLAPLKSNVSSCPHKVHDCLMQAVFWALSSKDLLLPVPTP
jgi:hypothetical protein